jgi:PKD repeat protein
VADARRSNAEDIDLNRNFHDFSAGAHPDDNEYAVETQLFMDYASTRNFVMSGNSHAGAELLNYPYDTEPILPADNDWWVLVCREYADTVHEVSSSYLTDEDNGVTNGYAWYQAIGTRQDYMNYYHNCKEVTMELSSAKLVDSELLPDYWDYNRNALLNYLQQVRYGLRGIITDSITHEPLEAMVFIDGYDFLNSHVYSFPVHGDYYRLLINGNYSVTFSAEGYKSKTIEVNVNNYEQTILDVELANLDAIPPTAGFLSTAQSFDCNPQVIFTNTSEASITTTYLWDFGDGTTSSEVNPLHNYGQNGYYTVKLFAENEHGEDSVIKNEYISVNLSTLNDISDYVICQTSGSVLIELPTPGAYQWFYELGDQTPFHTLSSFTTPILTENITYFVQEVTYGEVLSGTEQNNSQGGEYVTGDNYLLFNCLQECVLQSVKVYADGPGIRTIYLKNSLGDILYSEDFEIADGLQTVNLNYNLPIENGLKLGCSASLALYRGATGIFSSFDYPFNIGSAVSITQSNVVWWNDGNRYYAYFYDWQIKLPDCYSERTPLAVYVNQNPEAGFVFETIGSNVLFTNTSLAAESFIWSFGDETSSTEQNPEHEFLEDGTYIVTLTANSGCGSDVFTSEITISTGISDILDFKTRIYPNPTNGLVYVKSENEISSISIYDIAGRLSCRIDCSGRNSDYTFDIATLKQGIYLLEIEYSDNIKSVTKLTKN